MKEKDLKHRLQQTFDFSTWKAILPLFFKKIDYFSHPENLFTENDKVIEGQQIGTIKLDDGKQLAIFTIEVANNISIVRNRQGLREIAAKHIDQNIIHGALAFFYNKNQVDYRFSFIAKEASLDWETGELKKDETKPKRFTYLLGANEACTTPAKRMLVLTDKREKGEVNIKELKEVFSVEALNKDFFKTYKAHYEKFARYLADESNPFRNKLIDTEKETKDKEEKPIRDFVKKLLGRIVFLQFLGKKGWMGCDANSEEWTGGNSRFLYQLFEYFSKPEKFHSQCLTKLFFETLNTKRNNDVFEVKGLSGKLNGSRVPYLNGGLFEPEKNKATLEVDFPVDYFKELLEFFDQYNFTIDENSPDDHEVGIDPEMLGHIFENLLEDNCDKGAFYTPKEIVQYMCKESLIQYLFNYESEKLKIKKEDWEDSIEKFIRFQTVNEILANKEVALIVNQKLDDIKVCDPAIGSGAFPIGMLQEIFEAKRFIYPHLKTNKEFNPAQVKKNIIQHSIYGVDIEKGAVDIAQLRFWLNLVVDEINPSPLPNLDYKIMQGNSLLEQYEGIELGNAALFKEPDIKIYQASMFEEPKSEYGFSKEKRADINSLISDYFKVEEKAQKTAIHKQIDSIVMDHIDKSLEFFENRLLIEIATYEKQLDTKLERLTESQKQQLLSKSKELKEIEKRKKQLKSKSAARKRLLDFENTDERPYFLWHLYFMDVFEQGGFDIMIGNPPYIQLQKMGKETDILQEAGFETFTRTGDIYCLFYEKGINLLKISGVLTYITSNKWMRAGYGKSTRAFFCKHQPLKLIDLGSGVFESATVDTNILTIQKTNTKPKKYALAALDISKEKEIRNWQQYEKQWVNLCELTDDSWTISSQTEQNIKAKIERIGKPLKDWDIQIYRGILTGFNEAFIIDGAKKNELIAQDPKSAEIIKPILRGRDIKRYKAEFADLWLIATFPALKLNIDDYPAVKNYLYSFGKKLNQTGETYIDENGEKQKSRKKTGNKWFETQDQIGYYQEFEKEKIIFTKASREQSFYFTKKNFYVLQTAYICTGEFLSYLSALLNSKLTKYVFFKFYQSGGIEGEITVQSIENIPIPQITQQKQQPFINLVNQILERKENNKDTAALEQQIDNLVYRLYELTYEEVKVIDPEFSLSQKEYESIELE
ncbi:MAG: hypothetical protein GX128_11020 [Bacteroidales bacterium]|jgi:hypothetical protein|nr:hypothetical protein [Bacteroidales bacterium]